MTGWTWEQVRLEMTIPRLKAMQKLWAQHPPVHILVAGYLGYKHEEEGDAPSANVQKEQDLSELVRMFSAAGGIVQNG